MILYICKIYGQIPHAIQRYEWMDNIKMGTKNHSVTCLASTFKILFGKDFYTTFVPTSLWHVAIVPSV